MGFSFGRPLWIVFDRFNGAVLSQLRIQYGGKRRERRGKGLGRACMPEEYRSGSGHVSSDVVFADESHPSFYSNKGWKRGLRVKIPDT